MHLRNRAAGKTVLPDEKVNVMRNVIFPQTGLKIGILFLRGCWAKTDDAYCKMEKYIAVEVLCLLCLRNRGRKMAHD